MSQRAMMGLCLGMAALVFLTFTCSVQQWYKDWAITRQASASSVVIAKIDQASDLIAAIPSYHLFGKPISQVPVSNLHMSVTGIVKVSNQSGLVSKAYISIDGQASKIYKVGDELPNGVRINAISHDAVILENDGKFEKLPLPRQKLNFKPKHGGSR